MRKTCLCHEMKALILIMALVLCMVTSLLGVACMISASAATGQEEPTSTVTFTSYTTVMNAGDEFEFAALVTNEDGTTSTEVTWSSSNEEVIVLDANLAIAIGEGTATITATAPDGATADIDVLVSDEAARVESIEVVPAHLELGVGWKTTVTVNVLPLNAMDRSYTLSSSDSSILTVTADGYVTAVAAGEAEIIATVTGNTTVAGEKIQGVCTVEVIAALEEAELSNANPVLTIYNRTDLTVTFPEGVDTTGATYRWYTAEPAVASFDENEDETGTLRAWSFGSTEIYVFVTLADGTRYGAIGRATVNADFFYLVGLASGGWVTYNTAADAEAAGALLVQDPENPDLYSITRNIWAYEGFQIWHAGINADRTTQIGPYWYSAAGSSDNYIEIKYNMFRVNTYGVYTVTLDLNDGMAKVYINVQDAFATLIDPEVMSGYTGILRAVGSETKIEAFIRPTNATVSALEIAATLSGAGAEYVEISEISEPVLANPNTEAEKLSFTITVSMTKDYEGAADTSIPFLVNITINEDGKPEAASNSIQLAVASEEAVLPSTVTFEQEVYEIDVNTGTDKAWEITVLAIVDDAASIKGVQYFSEDIAVNAQTGLVSASGFGSFTVTARAVGDPTLVATTTVVVYSSQFYLAGILHSENRWDVLPYTDTSIEGTVYENWGLTAVEGSLTEYEGTFSFNQYDMFSIVFLGMSDSWYGAIDSYNIDWGNSSVSYLYQRYYNICVNETGMYTIHLDLAAEDGPKFTVKYAGEAFTTPHDMVLFLMRADGSWLFGQSNLENVLVNAGTTHVDGEGATTLSFTYDFAEMLPTWPTFQFATATGTGAGLAEAFWYGSWMVGITISGDAYSATGAEGAFTNYRSAAEGAQGCEFWYVGAYRTSMAVTFTVSFNQYGLITAIEMNWAE